MKILHVVGHLGKGGDTTAILNILDYIENNGLNYNFEFLTHKGANEEVIKKLKDKGINTIVLENDAAIKPLKYYKELKKILKNNKYDAIHLHTSFQSFVGLYAAKKSKVKVRVCHSHTTNVQRKINLLKKIFYLPICRFLINCFATHKVSCSIPAGKFLFGKKAKFNVIYNGLNIDRIQKTEKNKIDKLIKEYDLNNRVIIGQVGNFNENKNQSFTLELAKELNTKKYIFFLLGDGPMYSTIEDKIKKEKMNNIILTGRVSDVNNYMSLFDFLLLPTKYGEGLPVTLIEEQIINNNCECIASRIVTDEANLGNVKYLELNKEKWIEQINNKKLEKIKDIQKFDINTTAKEWLLLYEKE
ncbi:MAG: glycosyltransferase [Bacilli bacterium]|nr:glycosyltransferase [Bacilli bacterium]